MASNHDPRGTWDPMVDYAMMSRNVRGFMSLFHAGKPVVCMVHGFCVAGGTDMALCSDLLVIEDEAKIGYPPARVWGSPTTSLWAHRVGAQRAKRLLFTGDSLSGAEAVEWGLAIEAPAAGELRERTEILVERIARVPVNQLMLMKLLVNQTLYAHVVYSATKYIGGHGTSIGGLIIDGGNFPWEQHAERFPLLTQPDEAYHGAIWTEAAKPLGPIAYALRARVKLLRDIGAALSPFNAFQLLQGLETLPLRLRQHNENAIVVANFLKGRSDVSHVIFPGLQTGEPRRRADAYLKGGYGGLDRLRAQGRRRGRAQVHRLARASLSCRQYRRRTLARHSSRLDHASAIDARGAARGRRHARLRAPFHRPRTSRRHSRGFVAGARRGGPRLRSRAVTQGGLIPHLSHTHMKGASMSKDITTTVRPSRRTLLKTVGAVGVAAAGGVLEPPGLFAGDRGAGAEDQARLD